MTGLVCIGADLNPLEERSDQELVAAANAGNAAAFEALYFRYRDWVANLAYRFCGDRELALDLLQETFIYLTKKFPGFELSCQMKSFLYPVVKHLALNARAKANRFVHGDELFAALEAPIAEPSHEEELRAELARLPLAQRETIILRFIEGMDLAEIAAALD